MISPQPPVAALLVEWSQLEATTGPARETRWEGLIVYARGGGEAPWRIEIKWVRAELLQPI